MCSHLRFRRRSRGSALLEAVFCLMLFVPVFLLLMDVGLVMIASVFNHDICCFAARSASIGTPNAFAKGLPRKRAMEALNSSSYPRMFMSLEADTSVTETVKPMPDEDVYGGQVDGAVTINTVAAVHPPFLLLSMIGKKEIMLYASQTYPYTASIEAASPSLEAGMSR